VQSTKMTFPSQGLHCEANLFLPQHTARPPVVVMGHGYGAERGFGTNHLVEAFVSMGLAVFLFDYRYFGGSEGQPRQLIDPKISLEDWRSALTFVRQLDSVDAARLAIWGSSYGGGHVLSTAAGDHHICAVIAQVPHCDSRSIAKNTPLSKALQAAAHGLLDLALARFGRVHRVAIVGDSEQGFAILDFPNWKAPYLRLASQSESWSNSTPARSLFNGRDYNPVEVVSDIRCPVLILSAEHDAGIAPDDVGRTVAGIADCRHVSYPGDHFDLYDGWPFCQAAAEQQCRFLREVFSEAATLA
jgi:fermentation-respiration switch protein FrsA (DUF1100 family)